jgi:4-carboxymuconolactone decarboxylase
VTPRIPPLPPEERDEPTTALLATMKIGEGELNIFTTLARHPAMLKRWAAFGGTLLFAGELPARERELLILRTGYLTRAEYEWGQHVAMALASGVQQDEVDRIPAGPDDPDWSDDDATLLRAADELHAAARISDETWQKLAARLDERQLIEVCMLVGQYHLVAFTVNSLGVEPEPGLAPFPTSG